MKLRRIISISAIVFAAIALSSCVSVNKNGNGDNVDVKTPFGSVSVRTDQVKPEDTGLNVYPGATLVPKQGHDSDKANVTLSSPWGQLKVVALNYHSDDPPEKVLAWYRSDLQKKYGKFLECKGTQVMDHGLKLDNQLTCGSEKGEGKNYGVDAGDGNTLELKTGTDDKQHIVAVKPESSGSNIALVYVQKHGEKDSI
ncbi:MAG: hypothetical protein JOZ10_07840 [Acidobacteria bacterium]|nr:hypothetical protein [Acidobacteriota bacterium]MBV9146929.1 hypothetical protein [Acidobacteriota bacterium]MBV9434598.1 hypothetical protein [Acidobacteriota bacterium]